ncbi:MAG: hypothetical protein ACOY4I_14000 [Bacillota bacterium]
MLSLNKTIFAVPPQIRQKLFSGEYVRVGGVIKEKASDKTAYLLVDRLSEEREGSSMSVSIPEIMDSTLKYLTSGQIRKQLEHLERELDSQNIQIKPEDLSIITGAIDSIHMRGLTAEELGRATEGLSRLYTRYHDIFSKYLKDLDRPKDLQSFPFVKILILIAVTASKLCMQSDCLGDCKSWIRMVSDDITEAMKVYCLLNSKTDKDLAHFTRIAKYPASEFFYELKEIIASPATKPKYKFPPMEVIYLWNCAEYLEGYMLELENK